MIPKIIEIGPFTLHLYGLLIALGILAGWYVAKKRAHAYKIDPKIFDSWSLTIPLFLGLMGARLYHVLDYWPAYMGDPAKIIQIQNGGLGIWGALAGALLGLFLVGRIEKINLLSVLDLAAPSMALGQAIGRVGNWINQEGFGPPTNLPWKVYIDPQNRPEQYINSMYFHPSFLYESILNLSAFALLLYISKKTKKPGQIFASYLILYGVIRLALEFYRIDTWQIGEVKVAQIIALVSISAGIGLLKRMHKGV